MTYFNDKELLLVQNSLLGRYQAVLFDADKTLFSFDDRHGLEKLFTDFSLKLSDEQYAAYKTLNSALWEQYHNHAITTDIIKKTRFQAFSSLFDKTSEEINTLFLEAMLAVSEPLEGAQALLDTLRRHGIKTGIITNGLTHIQARRVKRAGFDSYIDALIVSEAVGKAKPHPDIFRHALTELRIENSRRVLMVGDSLETDIAGGKAVNMDTCWLASSDAEQEIDIKPTFQIATLQELLGLLLKPMSHTVSRYNTDM